MTGAMEVVDGIAFGLEPSALVNAGEEARAPVGGGAFGEAAVERVGHDDEGGEFAAFASESVGGPGADAGHAHAGLAGVHHEEGRAVVVRLGVTGVDEGHFVDVLAEFGEDGGDHFSAFTARGEFEGRLHEGADGVGEEAGVFVESGQFIAVHFFELGFVVPGVDLTGAAIDEEPDDGLGLTIEMTSSGCERIIST